MAGPWLPDEPAHASDTGTAWVPPPFDHERWVRLRRDQLGVDVIDPLGHHTGYAAARDNWFPVDGVKHVLVGELDRYYRYDGSGHEVDWNLCIFPNPQFRFILDDVAELMPNKNHLVHRRRGPGHTVECEITPDEAFWANPYFWVFPQYSSLTGEVLGVYGPWVRDRYHGGRPEIHPCEVIWWTARSGQGNVTSRYVLVLQDDSERFARAEDYSGPVTRPWAAFPRRTRISFALRPRIGDHLRFALTLPSSREVIELPGSSEPAVTAEHAGQVVISVEKNMDDPAAIRARLGRVADDPDGTHLRCFLTVDLEVGRDDDGREGHALLVLENVDTS